MIVYLRFALLTLALFIAPTPAWTAPTLAPSLIEKSLSFEEIAKLAKETLPQEGVLVRKSDGYVYLKVDDRYIHDLFPLLGVEGSGFTKAPYFRSKQAPGAHISVFYKNEMIDPDEVGKVFHFTVRNVAVVENRQAQYIVLQVESKELEELRVRYGLKPLLHGHAYHITIAKQNLR